MFRAVGPTSGQSSRSANLILSPDVESDPLTTWGAPFLRSSALFLIVSVWSLRILTQVGKKVKQFSRALVVRVWRVRQKRRARAS